MRRTLDPIQHEGAHPNMCSNMLPHSMAYKEGVLVAFSNEEPSVSLILSRYSYNHT